MTLPTSMLDGKRGKRREIDIQRAILQFLAASRIVAWQNTTGAGLRVGNSGRAYKVRFGIPGTPDIGALVPTLCPRALERHCDPGCKLCGGRGRFARAMYIEVKAPRMQPEPHQVLRMRVLSDAGAIVFCAHSVAEVAEQLDREGIARV